MVLKGYLLSILYALICLGLGMFAYKLGAPKKITRKIVHILVGFEWVILYRFMGGGVHFLAVCLIFLAILTVSHFKGLMPMISSDGDNSPGTVYYAVAMSIMSLITLFLPDMIIPFGIGVFCTSFGDGLAGLVGQSVTSPFNKKIYGNKTIIGAVVNLVTCFLTAFVFSKVFNLPLGILYCIFIAIFALELELFCGMGLDNIAITLGSSLLSYFLIGYAETPSYILPILLTPLMIAFASKKKALTKSGIIAAIVVDLLISVSLGNFGFLVLLAFFVCGVGVDKIKKHSKKAGQSEKNTFEKRGDCRDYVQVFANSLVASICAFAYLLSANRLFIIAFVASLAEALADTVLGRLATEDAPAYEVLARIKGAELERRAYEPLFACAGEAVYLVGGSLRDLMRGEIPHD